MIDPTILDVEEGLWPPSRISHRDCPSCHCERDLASDPVNPDPVWLVSDPAGHTWITNRYVLLRDDVVELESWRETIALPAASERGAATIASASPAWNHKPTTAMFQSFALDLLDAAGAKVIPHEAGLSAGKPFAQRPHAIVLDGRKVGAIMPVNTEAPTDDALPVQRVRPVSA